MDKYHRNERIGAIIKILTDNPNMVITLNYFTDMFNAAKSTISEDIVIVKKTMEQFSFGTVETLPGAAGGVKYIPDMGRDSERKFIQEICTRLTSPDRIIPGGFLYMTDIIYSPDVAYRIGEILAARFMHHNVDYVLTVETKGIPIAFMTARALNAPLVIVRRNTKVTEGPTVSINYVSGSAKRIQSMSLSRRAIKRNTTSVFIDDFMKAGGTAMGILELMKEFENEVLGIGVLIETREPEIKLVNNYISLLTLNDVGGENGMVNICPSPLFI